MSRGTAQVVQAEVCLAFSTVIPFFLYPLSKRSRQMSPVSLGRLESPESRSSKLTGSRVLLFHHRLTCPVVALGAQLGKASLTLLPWGWANGKKNRLHGMFVQAGIAGQDGKCCGGIQSVRCA